MTPSNSAARAEVAERQPIPLPSGPDSPLCPTCGGRMWDNRMSKRNPKAPDFKCRNRSCDGLLWPGQQRTAISATQPPRLAAIEGGESVEDSADESAPKVLPILRQKYLDLTAFALDSVRPEYETRGMECRPDTVAAIVATLYIAETRRDGL